MKDGSCVIDLYGPKRQSRSQSHNSHLRRTFEINIGQS